MDRDKVASDEDIRPEPRLERRWRPLVRFVLAVGGGAILTRLVWIFFGNKLSIRTDIIGYPTFYNYDSPRLTDGYYLIVFVFPLLSLLLYLGLAWLGPLRRQQEPNRRMFPVVGAETDQGRTDGPLDDAEPSGPVSWCWTVGKVVVVATTVALEVGIVAVRNQQLGSSATYVAAVIVFFGVLAVGTALWKSGQGGRHTSAGGLSWRASVALTNSSAALAVIPLLYLASNGTSVVVGSADRTIRYPWLPWWVMSLALLVAFSLWVRGVQRARKTRRFRELEANTLTWVVGPVLFFLLVAILPTALGTFQGFDDAQYLAGTQLVFHHGLLPWREIYALHGLLNDVLDGAIGMIVFGDTRWGINAGFYMLVNPLNLIVIYGFTAYFGRRNRLVLVALIIAFATGLLQGGIIVRFLLFPIFLILLDQVLKRPDWVRCSLFMLTMFVGTILTEEEALFVPLLLGTVVIFELASRERSVPILEALPRSLRCLAAGGILSVGWLILLAVTRSTNLFFDSFLDFSQGHSLEGSYPVQWSLYHDLTATFYWIFPTVLFLATFWRVVAKLRVRSSWSTRDWTMVAAAMCSAVYFLKALDRADTGHVLEAFSITVPLLILWVIEILSSGDRIVRNAVSHRPRVAATLGLHHVVTGLTVIGVIVGASAYSAATSVPATLRRVPNNFHRSIPAGSVSASRCSDTRCPAR